MKSSLEALDWPRALARLAVEAESPLGREVARHLTPFRAMDALREAIGCVREAGAALAAGEAPSFAAVEDLAPLLERARARGTGLEGRELAVFLRCLKASESVRRRLRGRAQAPALQRRARSLPDFSVVADALGTTVDAAGAVLDEAAPGLAEVRREFAARERQVRELALALAARADLRPLLREGPPVLRDGRFMLAVKAGSRGHVRGIVHDHSASGESVFVEPEALIEPQNLLADLRAREHRLVDRALLDRTRELLHVEGPLHEALRLLASLDAIFARARLARALGATLIEVDEAGPLVLREARHPLLLADAGPDPEAARRAVVPFDVELGGRFDVLVLSGPNTGGKTATLKAIGLIVALALAAVPVPVAAGSRVPWYDEVHADVGDEQDLKQSLSTFSGHLRRISDVLARATARSLVLLDELGTGTEPKEGEALGRALLLALLERGCKVVATTHLSGLKDLGFELERVENASLEFDGDTLRPLFRLTLGLPGESNALKIARRLGIPPAVVERAEEFLGAGRGSEAGIAREQAERARRAALQHLETAERQRRGAEAERARLEEQLRLLEEKSRLLEDETERAIHRQLRAAQERGRAALAQLGTLPAGFADKAAALARFVEELAQAGSLAERRAAYLRSRKKGDSVWLPKYREQCVVQKVDRPKRRIELLYRGMTVEVSFDEVQCPDDFAA